MKDFVLTRFLMAVAMIWLLVTATTRATSDTWDGSNDGIWGASANWATDPAAVPGTGDTATFSGAGNGHTTIDLGAGVTIGSIVFDTSSAASYTLGAGGAGSNTLSLDNGGMVRLHAAVTNNQMVSAKISLSSASNATAIVTNSSSALLTLAGGITARAPGVTGLLTVGGSGNVVVSGIITNLGASTNALLKTGSGMLTLSTNSMWSGAGALGRVPATAIGAPLVAREGTLLLNGGTHMVNGELVIGGVVADGGAGQNSRVIVDSGTVNVSGFLSVGRGNGIGGVSSDLVASNSAVISAANLSAGYNGNNAANNPRGSIALNNASSLTITGNGVFYVAESAGSDMNMTMNGTSQLIATGGGVKRIGGGGTGVLNINDSANVNFGGNVDVGYVSGSGVINLSSGTMTAGVLRIASSQAAGNAVTGSVTVGSSAALTTTGDLVVGLGGARSGSLAINGGTVNVGPGVLRWMIIGQYDTVGGRVDINSGNLNLHNSSAIKYTSSSGGGTNVINQNGGSVTFYSNNGGTVGGTGDLNLQQSGLSSAFNTYNLNGGTLTVPQIASALTTGTRVFNFNGGTLKAAVTNTAFLNLGSGNARANVRDGGAIIDTNGKNVTIAQALLHSNLGDAATDGGLTKLNPGELTLTGANTYTGPTIVSNGTLVVYGPSLGGAIVMASNTVLMVTNATAGGSMSMEAGAMLALTNGVAGGTLAVSNGLTLGNGVVLNLDLGATADRIVVAGGAFTNMGGVTIRLTALGGYATGTNALIQTIGGEIVSTNAFILDSSAIVGASPVLIADGGSLKLVVTVPATALWWKGDISAAWNEVSGGNYNWDTDQASGIDAGGVPGVTTNVFFAAHGAANLTTTLGRDFEVNRVTFQTNNVTIGGANALTIDAGIAGLVAGSNAISASTLVVGGVQTWSNVASSVLSVSSAISGSATLTKDGAGVLALSGAGTYSGNMALNEGTLSLNSASALGNSTNGGLTINGGVLDNTSGNAVTMTAAKAQTWAGDFTFGGTTSLNFNAGPVSIPGSGTRTVTLNAGILGVGRITGANAGLTLSGSGMLAITEDSTASSTIGGTLTVGSGSTLRINTGPSAAASMDFYASGLAGSGAVENGGGVERWLYIINTNDCVFPGVLRNGGTGALGLNKSGSGTLTLNGASNPYGGQTTIQSGTLQLGDGVTDSVMTNSSAIVNTGTLVFNVASSNSYGRVISGTGSLVKNGSGVLTLSGANSYGGYTTVNGGTLNVVTGGVANSSGNGGGTYFNVGTVSNVNTVLRINGGAANLYTASGTAWASFMQIGNGAGCRGFVSLTSGSITAQRHLVLGNITSGYGAMTMSGGTVTIGSYFITGFGGGVGVFNQTGGAVTQNQTVGVGNTLIGSGPGSFGVMTLMGGSFTATAGGLSVSENSSCTGILNIGGSASVTAGNIGVRFGNDNAAAKGILNLMGGSLTANIVQRGNGSAIFNFHGGTLKASTSNNTFMTGLSAAYVYPEGAVIHDNSNTITVAQALLAPAGYGVSSVMLSNSGAGYLDTPVVTLTGGSGSNATAIAQIDTVAGTVTNILVTNPGNGYGSGDILAATLVGGGGSNAAAGTVLLAANTSGGLVKLGTGTITLTGSNTYTGATAVSNGTLAVNGSVAAPVNVYSNGTLSGTGRVYGAVTVSPGGTLRAGLAGSTGTLLVAQATLNSGILGVSANSNLTCNVLNVSGTLSLNGAVLNVADASQLAAVSGQGVIFTIATASGISGEFASDNLPDGWWVRVGPNDIILTQNAPGFLMIVR